MPDLNQHLAAVIGAGPAGLFAARELAANGVKVILLNRDIKPGGLAEYGIYLDKYKMKNGLRAQFRQIIAMPEIDYYGNVLVDQNSDLTLNTLRELGVQALLVTAGAQGTKWLGLPGEQLKGVYHAKDIVYHYNLLPPYSQQEFAIGRRVALIGMGNVMADIAHYLISVRQVEDVVAVARRGPAEMKMDRKELESIAANLDLDWVDREIDRAAGMMQLMGRDPAEHKAFLHTAAEKAPPTGSRTHFAMRFLLSPLKILGDEQGRVTGLEVEENTLVEENGAVRARGTGVTRTLEVDTIIFAIGDSADESLGLPVRNGEFIKSFTPRFPMEGLSYEVYNPAKNQPVEDVFVAGWARQAGMGVVGLARKDGTNGARAMMQYLQTLPAADPQAAEKIGAYLSKRAVPAVDEPHLGLLIAAEQECVAAQGLPDFKFASNEEMLAVMGLGELKLAADSSRR